MDFSVGRPDVVRAINQRWLLNFWKGHFGPGRVPQWQSVETEKLSGMSANLSLLGVTGSGDGMRFMVRFNGAVIAQVYGTADFHGKYLDEFLVPAALEPYLRTVQHACPIYTIQDLTDRNGRLVHFERLLLPFARDGKTVDRILASHELVSLDGAFDGHDLMQTQTVPPPLRMAVKIQIDAL